MRTIDEIGIQLNGLDLVGPDDNGVWWTVGDFTDWASVPESTGEITQHLYEDGGWPDVPFWAPKTLVLVGTIQSAPRLALREALRKLTQALPKNLQRVAVSEDGLLQHQLVRLEGKPKISWVGEHAITYDIQLVAPDPRKLGGDGSTAYQFSDTAFLPSTSGGLQLPVTAPFNIAATVVNGSVAVTAEGDAPPPVLVRINGPAVQPIIRDQDGGAMPLDISLDAGQWLDVDLDAKTIKINSTVNRRNLLRGPWITARAGMVLSLDAAVYNPLTSMTVFWTDASY